MEGKTGHILRNLSYLSQQGLETIIGETYSTTLSEAQDLGRGVAKIGPVGKNQE